MSTPRRTPMVPASDYAMASIHPDDVAWADKVECDGHQDHKSQHHKSQVTRSQDRELDSTSPKGDFHDQGNNVKKEYY
jgi:hypothetical protein